MWLTLAFWIIGTDPIAYNTVAKLGPFPHLKACYAYGVTATQAMQDFDTTTTAVAACIPSNRDPAPVEFKVMWDLACAARDKPDTCWLGATGEFVNPMTE